MLMPAPPPRLVARGFRLLASSGGLGWSGHIAPLLARHGFAVLALAYFGLDLLPIDRLS